MDNPTVSVTATPDTLRALFGNAAPGAAPAASGPASDRVRLVYGTESADVPASGNVADAFRNNATALGVPFGRTVTYSRDGSQVGGADPVQGGATYVATVRHDGKGAR